MKNVPITLSLPENIVRDLHLYVSRRQISKFVSEVVEKGLENRKELLAQEFREASLDKEMNKEFKLWDQLSGDGLDETNSY
ncbi:MAG: hypothetical protein H0V82_05030 [Candidatus Protochlamydia sp.]|nr:hypothetical protein [Candidatus Protochlamydia sp.]